MKNSQKLPPGTIIFLNGTSSAGKTSLLKAIQDTFEEPFLDLGLDKFIWMLPGRYLERPLWDDVLGKASYAGKAGHQLVRTMHQAILTVSSLGNYVVADHVLVEPGWVRECADLFANRPAWLVGVRCPLEVLERRERERKNRTLGQARAQYDLVHKHRMYDLEVDASKLRPHECAARIREHIETRREPQAFRLIKAQEQVK
jgi:chloramphenicol 3-O phosphotransferase